MKDLGVSTPSMPEKGAETPEIADSYPPGWTAHSPRDEIRPAFGFDPKGGRRSMGGLVITHDHRDGLDGWFQKSYPVAGGEYYRFHVVRRCYGVAVPRRSALVRVLWQDEAGKMVPPPDGQGANDERPIWRAEPEHPVDGAADGQGWTTVSGIYHAPAKATRAIVELHLQWAPNGRVEWSEVSFDKAAPLPSRKVRLATAHYKPTGKSLQANREEFSPLVAEAARQRADLLVLGEVAPSVDLPQAPHEVAEVIPGPSTDYFGELARRHQIHIVLSLYERDGHLVYNTAVLLGPDGRLIGRYRKVCLPHSEVASGVAPGRDYPVFDTKLGKVGLMICYDGFFPEVARALSNQGAEVIAWPVWGCNPLLGRARACENHVYIVSSAYMDAKDDWMISAIFDPCGKPIATTDQWGTVAVVEVDLSQPYVGPLNLGDIHAMIPRHRPVQVAEPIAKPML